MASAEQPQSGDLEEVMVRLMPIWAEQVRTAREQTEEAITSLTGRFAKLVERLQTAVEASQRAAGVGNDDTNIVATMQKALGENRDVVKQVEGLVGVMRELENMVEVVKDVARQTDLIALNAAIEAARAGEAGKSFTVVAGEVRRLSQESRKAGQLIGEKISSISGIVGASSAKIRHSAATIESALLGMSGASQASLILQEESVGIHREICDVLVSLQFQDRVSQILNAVTGHMEELQTMVEERNATMPDEREPMDLSACMNSMASRYTTQEQHNIHGEESGDSGEELTFF